MSKKYSVRVVRTVVEEYVDLEVEANSPEEAERLAVADAKENSWLYFGPADEMDISYEVESADIEEMPAEGWE